MRTQQAVLDKVEVQSLPTRKAAEHRRSPRPDGHRGTLGLRGSVMECACCCTALLRPKVSHQSVPGLACPTLTIKTRFMEVGNTSWPHAPVHQLTEKGAYFLTASSYLKEHHFRGSARLGVLQRGLLTVAKDFGWRLDAWAVFSNHCNRQ